MTHFLQTRFHGAIFRQRKRKLHLILEHGIINVDDALRAVIQHHHVPVFFRELRPFDPGDARITGLGKVDLHPLECIGKSLILLGTGPPRFKHLLIAVIRQHLGLIRRRDLKTVCECFRGERKQIVDGFAVIILDPPI